MGRLLLSADNSADDLRRRNQPIHRNRSRLRTAVETSTTASAARSCVSGRMHTKTAQLKRQFQAAWRTRFNAQPTAFTFLDINSYVTAWWCQHSLLAFRF